MNKATGQTNNEGQVEDLLLSASAEDLEKALKEKKEQERKRHQEARKRYEHKRDTTVIAIIDRAKELNQELSVFKDLCTERMEMLHENLSEYGEIKSTSKGGFQAGHSEGTLKVVRRRDTTPDWDERAAKGVELIKEFLYDTVKKRDQKLFEILISFIEKNQNGDLEYAKVLNLISHRDKYTDQRWVEGLKLIQESYRCILKGYMYEFRYKDEEGKWASIDLNFSRI